MPDDQRMLIDAGESDNMYRFLRWRFNRRPTYIQNAILSHPDKDHYFGFKKMADDDKFSFGNVYHNGIVERTGSNSLGPRTSGSGSVLQDVIETPEQLDTILDDDSLVGGKLYPNLLRNMRETLGVGSQLLIGMDLVKDRAVLEAAYDDAQGVTAEFNHNLIRRVNRELDADIPLDLLTHEARWNDEHSRVEMHLVASQDIEFSVAGKAFALKQGESIHTENSHKFTRRTSNMLLLAGGWDPVTRWLDGKERFSLILAEARPNRSAP